MSMSFPEMSPRGCRRDIRRGELLLLLSTVAFSTAGVFSRLAAVNPWAMTFWRGLFGFAALLVVLLVTAPRPYGLPRRPGRREMGITACFAFGTVCFILALSATSVAHVVIIYATGPMISAGLAWLVGREAMASRSLATACLALLGVCITVGSSIDTGTLFGDALALAMTLSLSAAAVLARGAALPVLPMALLSSLLAAAAALSFAWSVGAALTISWRDALWLACFGIVTIAVAMPCYLAGATRLPAARTMLISAAEMPLAPLWVWLAFGEAPSAVTVIGGGVVAMAILADVRGV